MSAEEEIRPVIALEPIVITHEVEDVKKKEGDASAAVKMVSVNAIPLYATKRMIYRRRIKVHRRCRWPLLKLSTRNSRTAFDSSLKRSTFMQPILHQVLMVNTTV